MARCPLGAAHPLLQRIFQQFRHLRNGSGPNGVECMRCGPRILRAVMNRSNPFHRCPNITAIRIGTRYGASYQST
jgi:hypothetical protein